ncbi:MAG: hypothetical protein H5T84_10750, partial [Thermoleophilia bacterium]|nr:hypothetical protein [Thermoleophilia bacterium]
MKAGVQTLARLIVVCVAVLVAVVLAAVLVAGGAVSFAAGSDAGPAGTETTQSQIGSDAGRRLSDPAHQVRIDRAERLKAQSAPTSAVLSELTGNIVVKLRGKASESAAEDLARA